MVWDRDRVAPANLGGCILRGRPEERAKAACVILNQIYKNRLDACSVRADASHIRYRGAISGDMTVGDA